MNGSHAFAQAITVSGHLTGSDGLPLNQMDISVVGTVIATQSNELGEFRLEGIAAGQITLLISGHGFVPQQRVVILAGSKPREEDFTLLQDTTTVNVVDDLREYHVEETSLATRTPERLLDVPQAIQVFPNQLIQDRAILEGNELFRNISGVNQSTYSAMVFRGFTQREILYNGARGNPFGSLEGDVNGSGFSTSQIRLTNIQRVEVLKGPTSALYGSADAGGLINYVTKEAAQATTGEIQFRAGSYDQRFGSADVSRPLSSKVFSRGAFYGEDRNTFRNNSGALNLDTVANLMYKPDDRNTFSGYGEYINQNLRGQLLRGIPVNALGNFLTATTWSANEPSDRVKIVGRVLQLAGDHSLPRDWHLSYTYRLLHYENGARYHEPRGLNAATATGRTMRRQYRDFYRATRDWSFVANAVKSLKTGPVLHQVVAGFEQYDQDQNFRFATAREVEAGGTVPSIDLYHPIYGAADPSKGVIPAATLYSANPRRTGVYGQDEIILSQRLRALFSGRLDHYHDTGNAGAPLRYVDTALAGRIGLVYKATSNLSFYSNGANSVTRAPIYAQTPSANGPFAPETGVQFEVGAKSDLLQRKLSLTADYFHIDKRNILRADPALGPQGNNPNAVLATGRAKSEGAEFNLEGFLTSRTYTTFNYTYLNTRILQDTTTSAVGRRLPNAPRHTVGLFTRYNFLRHTAGGFGLEGVTNRVEPYAGIRAGGYVIADASLYQDFGTRVHAQFQVTNLANSTYVTGSLFAARAGNIPGQPRAFIFTLSVNPFRH